jgi:predicted DsbA family dithiol-disulfide isomerase
MGLSEQQFADDLVSVETNDALEDEIRRSRSMNANSFPSLVIEKDGGFASMEIDYNHPQSMIDVITRIADS